MKRLLLHNAISLAKSFGSMGISRWRSPLKLNCPVEAGSETIPFPLIISRIMSLSSIALSAIGRLSKAVAENRPKDVFSEICKMKVIESKFHLLN